MYRCSMHYKDACDAGKKEYAAAYRTLLMSVKAEQMGIDWGSKLAKAGYRDIIIMGAGDLCDIFLKEIKESPVSVCGIIDNNKKKYAGKYGVLPLRSFSETDSSFFQNRKVVITYVDKANAWINELSAKGVDINDVVTLEELVSYLILS